MKAALLALFAVVSVGCAHGSVPVAYPLARRVTPSARDHATRGDTVHMAADGVCFDAMTQLGTSAARTYADDDGEVRLAITETPPEAREHGGTVCFAPSERLRVSLRASSAPPVALEGPSAWSAPPLIATSYAVIIP